MNPYQVLGVGPSATTDEIETSYRHLLRAHHPDLHHGGSPDDLARAEQRTRELNEAIALIRAGWRPRPTPGSTNWAHADAFDRSRRSGSTRWDSGFHVGDDTDWFGHPYRERRDPNQVECPLCGHVFDHAGIFRVHLEDVHHLREDTFVAAPRIHRDRLHWMAWIPAPPLTLSALLFVYLAIVVHTLSWPWTAPAIWLGVIVVSFTMIKSMTSRHSI